MRLAGLSLRNLLQPRQILMVPRLQNDAADLKLQLFAFQPHFRRLQSALQTTSERHEMTQLLLA